LQTAFLRRRSNESHRRGIEFEFGVRPEDALDAFNHPYAYLRIPKPDSLNLLAA
jgi:hypothetical protein